MPDHYVRFTCLHGGKTLQNSPKITDVSGERAASVCSILKVEEDPSVTLTLVYKTSGVMHQDTTNLTHKRNLTDHVTAAHFCRGCNSTISGGSLEIRAVELH